MRTPIPQAIVVTSLITLNNLHGFPKRTLLRKFTITFGCVAQNLNCNAKLIYTRQLSSACEQNVSRCIT